MVDALTFAGDKENRPFAYAGEVTHWQPTKSHVQKSDISTNYSVKKEATEVLKVAAEDGADA